jgi:hypothetical protein
MFRHVVLFSWAAGVSEAQEQELMEQLRKLPATISAIREYRFGPDAGLNPANKDFVVVADFDDSDGYLEYRDHPAHRAVVERYITPFVTERAAVQYEF